MSIETWPLGVLHVFQVLAAATATAVVAIENSLIYTRLGLSSWHTSKLDTLSRG